MKDSECLQQPWLEEKDEWFSNLFANAYTSGFVARTRLGNSGPMRGFIDQFVKETGMDREKLGTLLKAMKESQKRNRFKTTSKQGVPTTER